jgi:Leucine-rich repeat (LRR) protein
MTTLKGLSLSNNPGRLHPDLSALTVLQSLDLSDNRSRAPSRVDQALTALQYLRLNMNQLTSPIPAA